MRGETGRRPGARPPDAAFQSTPLMRGETIAPVLLPVVLVNFNPLPSCEGRHRVGGELVAASPFQSTPLMRGETPGMRLDGHQQPFQSTPLMRGETFFAKMGQTPESFQSTPLMRGETAAREVDVIRLDISIHSPHARGDYPTMMSGRTYNISIHSPHARGDTVRRALAVLVDKFQSTPLMRGETSPAMLRLVAALFQSTPLMRAETRHRPTLSL